jgi:hypothetical protein
LYCQSRSIFLQVSWCVMRLSVRSPAMYAAVTSCGSKRSHISSASPTYLSMRFCNTSHMLPANCALHKCCIHVCESLMLPDRGVMFATASILIAYTRAVCCRLRPWPQAAHPHALTGVTQTARTGQTRGTNQTEDTQERTQRQHTNNEITSQKLWYCGAI